MTSLPPLDHDELIRRISLDVADGYDEELEMEIEDRHPGSRCVAGSGKAPTGKGFRAGLLSPAIRLHANS